MPKKTFLLILSLLIISLSPQGQAEEAKGSQKVTMQLNFRATISHVGFAYGVDKGYFAAEGIDLEMLEGKGNDATIEILHSDNPPRFVFTSVSNLVDSGETESKAKSIAQVFYVNSFGVVAPVSGGIKRPQDLKGKKIGFVENEAPYVLWPAFLKANGLKAGDVSIVFMKQDEKAAALKSKKVDAVGLNVQSARSMSKDAGGPLFGMNFATHGVPMIGDAIMVNKKFLADPSDRKLNCAMVKATLKSWREANAHPKEALESLRKIIPKLAVPASEEAVRNVFALTQTRVSTGKPMGYNFPEDYPRMFETLKLLGVIKAHLAPEEYFTNEFLGC